ncbi:MAG TPA: Gfo/Idh/MocA family oxidoreductase [Verrucomicrobiae bacterium]|nr:Gfo/Idh/MocA family oxidoreductase [Verrucomicrobiae bacterium]
MAKTLRVGMIGYGFMGKAHSNAWRQAPHFFPLKAKVEMHTICGRDRAKVDSARAQYGWQLAATDWREVVESPLIDIVDICTSNVSHAEIALAAAHAGKHVICEKPLAMNVQQSEKMVEAVRKSKVKNMVLFNYRRAPAVSFAKQMIDSGQLGEIRHFRGVYLQDWLSDPKFPITWRLRKETAGSGAHGDLNAHLIDMARFLVGDIAETVGIQETFIKERPKEAQAVGLEASAGKGMEKVTVDDASVFLARFASGKNVAAGAYGTFEATRLAPGHKNYNKWEINGSEGTLGFCFERMNELEYCDRRDAADKPGFKTIMVTQSSHPYFGAWWPPGHVIGYEHTFVHSIVDFVNAVATGADVRPDFLDGAKCVAVLEAAIASRKEKCWVKVPTVK